MAEYSVQLTDSIHGGEVKLSSVVSHWCFLEYLLKRIIHWHFARPLPTNSRDPFLEVRSKYWWNFLEFSMSASNHHDYLVEWWVSTDTTSSVRARADTVAVGGRGGHHTLLHRCARVQPIPSRKQRLSEVVHHSGFIWAALSSDNIGSKNDWHEQGTTTLCPWTRSVLTHVSNIRRTTPSQPSAHTRTPTPQVNEMIRDMDHNLGIPARIVDKFHPHFTELLSKIVEHSRKSRQNCGRNSGKWIPRNCR